jgi:hypothetical protein
LPDWGAVDAPLNAARPHRRIVVNLFDNKRNASWLLIVVSLGTILYGTYVVLRRHEVDCGSTPMHRNDICQSMGQYGTDQGASYTEQRRENIIEGVILFAFASLTGGYAVRNLTIMRRAKTTYPPVNLPF